MAGLLSMLSDPSIPIYSLGLLVFGLSLMVMWYTLAKTRAIPPAARPGLIKNGVIIALIGLVICAVGITMWGCKCELRPGDWNEIIQTGGAVVSIGLSLIIRVLGHGHLKAVKIGAWAVAIIGSLLFLAYFIMPYL